MEIQKELEEVSYDYVSHQYAADGRLTKMAKEQAKAIVRLLVKWGLPA